MLRVLVLIAVCLAVFWLPWPLAVSSGGIVAVMFLPVTALFVGVLIDVLYSTGGAWSFPLATLLGAGCYGVARMMHQFIKTRIMV
jgi:hypothetical protein